MKQAEGSTYMIRTLLQADINIIWVSVLSKASGTMDTIKLLSAFGQFFGLVQHTVL